MKQAIGLAVAVMVLVVAGLWYWQRSADEPAVTPQTAEPAAADPEDNDASDAPRYPMPAIEGRDRPAVRPLPSLDESDEYFHLELKGLLGEQFAEMLNREGLIERLVAAIDNLPRQRVAERVRPVVAPEGPLAVDSQDGSGEFQLSETNYRRYDDAVKQFTEADLMQSLDLYQRFYPLFQKAYVGLGYPEGYFNDRLVEVIDHLLATPEVQQPIMLVRPHVLYRFADESLESLSAGQKLMIRVGPQHRQAIHAKLTELRKLLLEIDQR